MEQNNGFDIEKTPQGEQVSPDNTQQDSFDKQGESSKQQSSQTYNYNTSQNTYPQKNQASQYNQQNQMPQNQAYQYNQQNQMPHNQSHQYNQQNQMPQNQSYQYNQQNQVPQNQAHQYNQQNRMPQNQSYQYNQQNRMPQNQAYQYNQQNQMPQNQAHQYNQQNQAPQNQSYQYNQQNQAPQNQPYQYYQQNQMPYNNQSYQYNQWQQGYPYQAQWNQGYQPTRVIDPNNPEKKTLWKTANIIGGSLLVYNAAIFVVYFLVRLIISSTTSILNSYNLALDEVSLTWFLQLFLQLAGGLAAILLLRGLLKIKIKEFFKIPPRCFSYCWKGSLVELGGSYVVGIVVSIFMAFISALIGNSEALSSPDFSLYDLSPLSMIFYFTALCVVAPIVEELIFRGFILRSLQRYGHVFAIVVSSVIFGVFHGNLNQAIRVMPIGLVLAYVAVRSNSIIPSIIIHAVNNFVSSLLTFLSMYAPEEVSNILAVVLFFGSIIGAILVLAITGRNLRLTNLNTNTLSGGQRAGALFSSPTIILFILYAGYEFVTYIFSYL